MFVVGRACLIAGLGAGAYAVVCGRVVTDDMLDAVAKRRGVSADDIMRHALVREFASV